MEFGVVGSKPFKVRLNRSISGKSCSHRKPRLRVRLDLMRQSSLTKTDTYLLCTVLCEFRSKLPLLGKPRRNCARSCPNTVVLLTAGLFVQFPVKVYVPEGLPNV